VHTLKKISFCMLIVGLLVLLIHYLGIYADRTLSIWLN
jgi:hypothetical protein